ncbi:hypothetical protein DFJ77DRAFT_443722 [Powellomyces hirtus]|nr:hypothetical protein DFJ77DRAFT_443722 [Powellomyces hirtus]
MEVAIVGLGCALEYMLNNHGKTSRTVPSNVIISRNNLPNGPLVYESHLVEEARATEQALAAAKHVATWRCQEGKSSWSSTCSNHLPTTRIAQPLTPIVVKRCSQSSPMFKLKSTISLLSGLPLDMQHNNMQPFFGSHLKQPGVENANSQVLLERFTGMPSTNDQGTYRARQEVMNSLPNNPENLRRPDLSQMPDLYQRVGAGVKPSYEYQTPDINQTRGVNNKQITYEGVIVPGQKGSSRGMLPTIQTRWDMSKETTAQDMNPNRAAGTGKQWALSPVIRNTASTTQSREVNYFSAPNFQRKNIDIHGCNLDPSIVVRSRISCQGLRLDKPLLSFRHQQAQMATTSAQPLSVRVFTHNSQVDCLLGAQKVNTLMGSAPDSNTTAGGSCLATCALVGSTQCEGVHTQLTSGLPSRSTKCQYGNAFVVDMLLYGSARTATQLQVARVGQLCAGRMSVGVVQVEVRVAYSSLCLGQRRKSVHRTASAQNCFLHPAKFGLRAAHLQGHLHNLRAFAAAGTNSASGFAPLGLCRLRHGRAARPTSTRHVSECDVRKPKETTELPLGTPP